MAKKKDKKEMVLVITVKPPGGEAPKKPTETANVDKCSSGKTGVKKANMGNCPVCGMYGVLPCAICQRHAR